jgi:uncharacterized membrane protein
VDFEGGPEWGESAGGDEGWGSALGGGPRGWGKRFFIRRIIEHVRATPEQERRIAGAVREFRDEMEKVGSGEGRRTRQELADALRRPTFDGVALGEQFARHDTVLEGARKAWVGLVARARAARAARRPRRPWAAHELVAMRPARAAARAPWVG